MMTTITKKHKLILLAALLFAAGSTVFMLAFRNTAPKIPLSYKCFKGEQGWGYDVLANDTIIIHQPFIPGETGGAGFGNEQQAAVAARFVIEKIKSGEIPAINHQHLQRPGVLRNQLK